MGKKYSNLPLKLSSHRLKEFFKNWALSLLYPERFLRFDGRTEQQTMGKVDYQGSLRVDPDSQILQDAALSLLATS